MSERSEDDAGIEFHTECELATAIDGELRVMLMKGRLPFILRLSEKTDTILRLTTQECKHCKRLVASWKVIVGSWRTYIGASYDCFVIDSGMRGPYALVQPDSIVSFRWEPVEIIN